MKRRVLITGSSRGIGRAAAVRLAQDGFSVVLHGRSESSALLGVRDQLLAGGHDVTMLSFDVADRERCRQVLSEDIAAAGAYYGVVCSAGITRDNAFPAITGEDWDLVMRTNLDGFYNVVSPLIMPMVQQRAGGRIVALSSVSGVMGNRGQVNYSAAKAGIIGATKALAVELAKRNITVNSVVPGIIETDMLEQVMLDEALKLVPARRVGRPEEVAGLIAYLFSDEAAYVTRQAICINGGML